MELAKYVACICEGSAEHAIMDILLDNDLLACNAPSNPLEPSGLISSCNNV
jgi:hypothetical protein